jgi:hypothetical protein
MRITDLLRPYQSGLERIVDETVSGTEVQRHVFVADPVSYVRSEPGSSASLPRGTLTLTVLGPDRAKHGDPANATSVIARLETGARALILFGWDPAELPYHRILDALTQHRCQVLQVAAVDVGSIGTATVIERVDELLPPRDPLGEPIVPLPASDDDRLAMELRMANEYAFGEFSGRILRSGLLDSTGRVEQPRLDTLRAQMEHELQVRDKEIRRLTKRIDRYQRSSSYRLGNALINAANSPRALVRLPVDLIRTWRTRDR